MAAKVNSLSALWLLSSNCILLRSFYTFLSLKELRTAKNTNVNAKQLKTYCSAFPRLKEPNNKSIITSVNNSFIMLNDVLETF